MKLFINGTIFRSYAGATREVNYANVTSGAWNMSFHWDKKTGIMYEENVFYRVSYTENMTNYYMNMSIMDKLTTTNMWPAVFTAHDGYAFEITMMSNSTLSDFNFSEVQKQISFNVTGPLGKTGCCNVTIPKTLLQGNPWTILLNGSSWTTSCTITGNNTCNFVFIAYNCSTNKVQIIGTWVVPEYPYVIILMFFVFSSGIVAILLKRMRHKICQYDRYAD
jgi:hypothetical protein